MSRMEAISHFRVNFRKNVVPQKDLAYQLPKWFGENRMFWPCLKHMYNSAVGASTYFSTLLGVLKKDWKMLELTYNSSSLWVYYVISCKYSQKHILWYQKSWSEFGSTHIWHLFTFQRTSTFVSKLTGIKVINVWWNLRSDRERERLQWSAWFQ